MIVVIADRCPCVLGAHLHREDLGCICLEPRSTSFQATLHDLLDDDRLTLAVVDGLSQVDPCVKLLEIIKSRRPDVPVFFVAPALSDRDTCELLSRGARYCYRHPIDLDHFREQVQTLIALKPRSFLRRAALAHLPLKAVGSLDDPPAIPENIVRAIRYLEDHATDRTLSIERLSRVACMSPFHFCRVFKKHTTRTPMQYLAFVRVEKAKAFLSDQRGRMTVATIANMLGFYDSSCFNRHFKKMTGLTPTTFKQQAGAER